MAPSAIEVIDTFHTEVRTLQLPPGELKAPPANNVMNTQSVYMQIDNSR